MVIIQKMIKVKHILKNNWARELLKRNELTEKHIKNIIDYVRKNDLKNNKEKKMKEFTFRMKKHLRIVLVI